MASQNDKHPLRKLLLDELRDLYNAEKQLTRALPKLAKNATSEQLRDLLETHLEETEQQVSRLEDAFEMLGEKARGKHCDGIAGIIEEGSKMLEEDFEGAVLDAGIIAGAQRAEHYEIGAYGSVMAWAKVLGMKELASLLDQTLEEEKAADKKLSALAESTINRQAATEMAASR
jgi:ferritin-like metal-binding protein YciE